ncbi:OB-fold domain-containing protein [Nocardioides sp. B-3]|uniref:OB-fold domain-containing protein n=1 Tax=Nocardioides sp. B-3 TaxID=2895565 RepID=UPI0021532B2C|nr:OB-fold domain-containing protein [Nocardioides sp. B-3]UUZ58781.1 OB-fold domain-containing protein [Nocardioides sp. B-3]
MTFRVLKFKPASRVDPTQTVRPVINRDTAFFFEGTANRELRIQKCNACGVLRHPPGPVCPSCHAMDRGHVVASGRGVIHSFPVHHAPYVPGKTLPLPLALVELEEGVRMVGAVRGPGVEIGAPVQVVFDRIDDDLTLASWTTSEDSVAEVGRRLVTKPAPASDLPVSSLPITPTLIVSTALATRDFRDVHHDRDLAVQRGSKDIFLNILTTTGLVQKYVVDWARQQGSPDARVTACTLRLGAPAYPGDTLELTGTIVSRSETEVVVDVVGAVSPGAHATSRVTVSL